MMHLKKVIAVAAIATTSIGMAHTASADGEHPALTPESVDTMIFPGESFEVDKTVHTPVIPPVLDVCLVVDLSGSYGDDLPNIKGLAGGIWDSLAGGVGGDLQMGLASFIDFPFSPWGSPGNYGYRLDQDLTSDKTIWTTAVGAMNATGGNDGPESQYEALYQIATGAGNDVPPVGESRGDIATGQECSYREGATKIVMLTTDAPFHNAGDPGPFAYPGASAADTQAALVAADIKVIGLKAPGAGGELDALAAATGGAVVSTASNSADIASAILAALDEVEIEVSMTSDCAEVTGGVIDTTFEPVMQTVTNGDDAPFVETISVASDAPGGVYTCKDWALIDGQPMVDAEGAVIYETKTILVPENFVTGGGNVTNGEKGKNRANLLTFGGNAGYMADGTLGGHWSFNFHADGIKIQTTSIDSLQFVDTGVDPAPPAADADTAVMEATARVKVGNAAWEEGCQLSATFHDGGEPQDDAVVSVDVSCDSGALVDSDLTGGNIQIHDGTKG